jgi:RecA/RadA recombinase
MDSVPQRKEKDDKAVDRTTAEALPLPSLALRYLLQNEGLPLGMVYHVVGPPAVFKSTFAVEIGR